MSSLSIALKHIEEKILIILQNNPNGINYETLVEDESFHTTSYYGIDYVIRKLTLNGTILNEDKIKLIPKQILK